MNSIIEIKDNVIIKRKNMINNIHKLYQNNDIKKSKLLELVICDKVFPITQGKDIVIPFNVIEDYIREKGNKNEI